jgi:hypothetical protein
MKSSNNVTAANRHAPSGFSLALGAYLWFLVVQHHNR